MTLPHIRSTQNWKNPAPDPELCGNFGALQRWKNCPATATGHALLVMAPEPENFYHSLVFEHLVNQTMLNIDAA